MNTLLAVFLGGGLGSLARYGTGKFMHALLPGTFPYGTLAANIFSSLVLGVYLGFTLGKPGNATEYKFLIAVGFCGGFSTFSAFSAETFELFKNGMVVYGSLNIVANLLACLVMIGIGSWIGRSI